MEENKNELQVQDDKQMQISKWWILLSGVIFTVLGTYFIGKPAEAISTFVFYIAFAKIIAGTAGLSVAFRKDVTNVRKWNLGISIIDLLFGCLLLASPYLKIALIIYLPFMLAAWAFVRGILVMIASVKNKSNFKHWWLNLLTGLLSVVAGIFIAINPAISLLAFMDVIAIFMIMMGISLLVQFAFLIFAKKN